MKKLGKAVDVLLVGSYPPPHGGQSVHISNLFLQLKRDGFQTAVVNTGCNKMVADNEVTSVNSSRRLLQAVLFKYKPKVVHLHAAGIDDFSKLVPIFIASLAKRFRWVLTIHSGNIASKLNSITLLKKAFLKIILSRIDRIICVNEVMRNAISGWIHNKWLTVISAFSITSPDEELPQEVEQFFIGHYPIICSTGFFEPVYGFELAIQGVKELKHTYKDIGLIIIANKKNSEKYKDIIEENGLHDSAFLCGDISHEKCLYVIKRATIFLRPTLYDGDSLAVREALVLNTPVVASETEFRPEGVVTFRNGDVSDMIEKVAAVFQGNNDKERRVHDNYDNLERIEKIYISLMNGCV